MSYGDREDFIKISEPSSKCTEPAKLRKGDFRQLSYPQIEERYEKGKWRG